MCACVCVWGGYRHVYGLAVNRLVKHGTTTACYFGTIHRRATEILADAIDTAGAPILHFCHLSCIFAVYLASLSFCLFACPIPSVCISPARLNACLRLSRLCATGQRAYVGKVCMDCNSPDFYVEGTDESAEETLKFVESIIARKNKRLTPVITPRFAPTCSTELLAKLGEVRHLFDPPFALSG